MNRFLVSSTALLLFLLILAGCGASFFISSNNGRLLVGISVDPPTADPITFPNGQVQFTAQGTFNLAPTSVNSIPGVVWTIDHPAFSKLPDSGNAFIDSNGLAHCASGFIGHAQVFATAAANPNQAVSMQNQVVGTAMLTCP
jgi:hypothetical protein